MFFFFFFKQKTAYEMRISDWSSDVCSSDLGGLTMVLPSQPSLSWDLGETRGTVAVRMPAHHIALELLEETGPLAVSSANRTGMTAAVTIDEARDMLGDSVAVSPDGGPSATGLASTILAAPPLVGRAEPLVPILRAGAVPGRHPPDAAGAPPPPGTSHAP